MMSRIPALVLLVLLPAALAGCGQVGMSKLLGTSASTPGQAGTSQDLAMPPDLQLQAPSTVQQPAYVPPAAPATTTTTAATTPTIIAAREGRRRSRDTTAPGGGGRNGHIRRDIDRLGLVRDGVLELLALLIRAGAIEHPHDFERPGIRGILRGDRLKGEHGGRVVLGELERLNACASAPPHHDMTAQLSYTDRMVSVRP